jgi:hypothetical protein
VFYPSFHVATGFAFRHLLVIPPGAISIVINGGAGLAFSTDTRGPDGGKNQTD